MSRRKRMLEDLDRDIRDHIERETQENVDRGMAPDEARCAALRKFGNVRRVREETREIWYMRWVEELSQDVHFGLRMLRKSPAFAAVAIFTLALGIGANTTIFSVVNGVLLEPLPYADASRLLTIKSEVNESGANQKEQGISLPDAEDVRFACTSCEAMAVYQAGWASRIRTDWMPDNVGTSFVSASFFPLLGVAPLLGRPILPSDVQPGAANVVVLNYQLWQDDFGGDSAVLHRSLLIEGTLHEIIGVMPREFHFPLASKGLWLPLIPDARESAARNARFYSIVVRPKRGVRPKEVNAELAALAGRLSAVYPKTNASQQLTVEPLDDQGLSRVRNGLLMLLGAVGFVLLIACVNTSALLVARSWARQREVGVRMALGATRWRLIRQFLTESVLLALAGGIVGCLLSIWGIHFLRAVAPANTPRIDRVALDGNVFWFVIGISLLSSILFGLLPALQVSFLRVAGSPNNPPSGWPGRGGSNQSRRLYRALECLEIALSVILAVGALLMVRSFEKLIHVDRGVRTDHLLTMHVTWSEGACGYTAREKCKASDIEALSRLRTIPGVEMAALSQGFALMGGAYGAGTVYVEGRPGNQLESQWPKAGDPGASFPFIADHIISSDYFAVLGIRLLGGRDFNSTDVVTSQSVAIVNDSFRRSFLDGNALGKRFAVRNDKQGHPEWMQIIGVVSDDRDMRLNTPPAPMYYVSVTQEGYFNVSDFVVRTSGNPVALAGVIEKQIWAIDKDSPIQDVITLDQNISDSVAKPRFITSLLSVFAILGLLLAMVGIYGVISYAVVQRTHEIGVRIAIGAGPSEIARLFVGEGLIVAVVGIAIGFAGALGLTRFLRSMLFEVRLADPMTFVCVALVFIAVSLTASYIPARRAMRVDPMVALRHE